MAKKDAEAQAIPSRPAALGTPCSLLELHNWLRDVNAQAAGAHTDAQVVSTATTIDVG